MYRIVAGSPSARRRRGAAAAARDRAVRVDRAVRHGDRVRQRAAGHDDRPVARRPALRSAAHKLAVCLAALSLSRPEATLLVVAIAGAAAVPRIRRRELRAAAGGWPRSPRLPRGWSPNQLLADHWFPNTGVAKSHFYLPGFDWTYWRGAVATLTGRMVRGVFWDASSPLGWPRVIAVLWLAGAIRVIGWARRERRMLAGVATVAAPIVLMLA